MARVQCCICGKAKDHSECNGIYKRYGLQLYCQDKDCQKAFIEDAGDPPPDSEHDFV